MKFVDNVIDLGAPEYNITGVAKVERISRGQVRITYYTQREDGNIVPLHVIWDYETYLASQNLYEQAYIELRHEWRDAKPKSLTMN